MSLLSWYSVVFSICK